MNFHKTGIIVFALLIGAGASAQFIASPYSNNGLGEVLFQGMPNNYGMGEVGIGSPTPWHINLQNPALLTHNTFSSFQVGLIGDFRNHESTVGKDKDSGASLRFMAMSFPVIRNRWTTSFALLPLSSVKYHTYSQDSIDTGVLGITQFQGDGGLSQLIWANGFRIYKSLALGVKASYVFGTIDRQSRVQIFSEDFSSNYAIAYLESTAYSDFNFSLGLSYRWILQEKKFLNFGATYDLSNTLEGTENQIFQRLRLSGTTVQTQIIKENIKTEFTLPKTFGLGVSYELLNTFQVGVDVKTQNWKSANEKTTAVSLRNTQNVAVGVSWTPDYQSVNSYLKRTTYRMGMNMKQLPYLVNNREINDFGINFGASFPVSGFSSLDAAFKFGTRGTTDSNLIKENYFQVVIGATINDRWFVKRRYD